MIPEDVKKEIARLRLSAKTTEMVCTRKIKRSMGDVEISISQSFDPAMSYGETNIASTSLSFLTEISVLQQAWLCGLISEGEFTDLFSAAKSAYSKMLIGITQTRRENE